MATRRAAPHLLQICWPAALLVACLGLLPTARAATPSDDPPPERRFWVEARLGATLPGGQLYDDAKVGESYGAGVGGDVLRHGAARLRTALTYDWTTLRARRAPLSGAIYLNNVRWRLEAAVDLRHAVPYVGIALGLHPWHAAIVERATGRRNAEDTSSIGSAALVGVELSIWRDRLALVPEFSFSWLGARFNAPLWGAGLAARWRL